MSKSIEVIARGVLRRGNSVLLCRNDSGGYFYLPGGHVEFGESAMDALAREFMEECHVEVQVRSLALVSEGTFEAGGKRHHELNLVFHVERVGTGEIESREKDISFHWKDLATIVDIDLRPASARAWLVTAEAGVAWASEVPKHPH